MRIFFGGSYIRSWMKSRDSFEGPNIKSLISQARERNDLRMLRLMGVDEQMEARVNPGLTKMDEEYWTDWLAADRAALIKA
jgi:hypothetical protein